MATVGWWVETPTVVVPQTAVLILTRGTPVVVTSKTVLPVTRALTITGGVPVVTASTNYVTPTRRALTITGGQAGILIGAGALPIGAALTIVGGVPVIAVSNNLLIEPATRALAATVGTPTVVVTDHKTVFPSTGGINLTGGTPVVATTANVTVTPAGATPSIAGGIPVITLLAPTAYRAAAAGITTSTFASPLTWTHTGVAGDLVVAVAACDRYSDMSMTYDGVAMKYRGEALVQSGYNPAGGTSVMPIRVFTIPITAGNAGAKTVSLANPGGGYSAGDSVSYTGVGGVGVPSMVRGLGTSMSQGPVTPPASGMIVQAFMAGWLASGNAITLSSLTGGTSRYVLNANFIDMSLRDTATASTTFTGTISASSSWGGITVPLYPSAITGPQLDAYGGFGYAIWTSGNISITGPTVVAGADVFVDVTIDRGGTTLTGATYDGSTMTLVDSQTHTSWTSGNAITYRYRRTGVAAGAKTIVLTTSGGTSMYYTVAVSSFAGVTSISTTKTSGTATAPSQSVTLAANQIALQTFGMSNPPASGWYPTGDGAMLWDSTGMLNYGNSLVRYSDLVGTNTFGMAGTTNNWGAIATVLS